MATYAAGVAGPIPLEDGRNVTAEQGPFELEVTHPHDQDLVDRGVIVAVDRTEGTPASPPAQQTTTPDGGDTNAGSGEKED